MITTKTIPLNNPSEQKFIETLIKKAAEAREQSILAQLNDLVVKGILVVKLGETAFYRSSESNELIYKEQVTLELNVQEYIDKLEKENSEMKEYIKEIKSLLNKGA